MAAGVTTGVLLKLIATLQMANFFNGGMGFNGKYGTDYARAIRSF